MRPLTRWSWLAASSRQGGTLGLAASGLVMALVLVVELAAVIQAALAQGESDPVGTVLLTWGVTLVAACFFVFLLAAFVGAVTGAATGMLLWAARRWQAWWLAAGFGAVVSFGLVSLARGLLWPDVPLPTPTNFFPALWYGPLSYVYVLAGGLTGLRLHRRLNTTADAGATQAPAQTAS